VCVYLCRLQAREAEAARTAELARAEALRVAESGKLAKQAEDAAKAFLPEGWTAHLDKGSGRWFFHNKTLTPPVRLYTVYHPS